ncbi:SseB family protein [Salinibacterium sp.]|uniref:SseB family protein n=1 Tax=Salinibacterium sp. TaxID=1915057 RepID=UPI00286A8D84|nr:SseB family protein [Salinibacterium sp.]
MADLVDNVALRRAIAAFSESSEHPAYLEVVRNIMHGDLLFDTTGSALTMTEDGSSIAQGSTLAFREGTGPDGERALFAFTRQEEVLRMHEDAPAAVQTLSQPAVSTLDFAAERGYGWLYLDPAGPTCGVKIADVQFALRSVRNDAVKAALDTVGPTWMKNAVIDALSLGGQLLYAVNETAEGVQVRTFANPAGQNVALAFTSAVEVVVHSATDAWAAIDISRIVSDALGENISGLVINPAGPWIELGRDDLLQVQARLSALG